MYENDTKNNLIASRNLSRYNSHIENSVLKAETVWCRMVNGDFESLICPATWHADFELQYCIEGSLTFEMDGVAYTLHEGEFLLIPPKTSHATVAADAGTRKLVFAFKPEAKCEFVSEALEQMKTPRVTRGSENFKRLLFMMLEYAYISAPLSAEAIGSLTSLMLYEVFRCIHPVQEQRGLKIKVFESDRRANDITTFIRENISHNIGVEDVADHLHICVRHINRIAKSETGYTVTELINNEKLACIKRLLRSDLSLHDIAAQVNFSSEYTLNRFFKRYEGLSIGAWRKSIEK